MRLGCVETMLADALEPCVASYVGHVICNDIELVCPCYRVFSRLPYEIANLLAAFDMETESQYDITRNLIKISLRLIVLAFLSFHPSSEQQLGCVLCCLLLTSCRDSVLG